MGGDYSKSQNIPTLYSSTFKAALRPIHFRFFETSTRIRTQPLAFLDIQQLCR